MTSSRSMLAAFATVAFALAGCETSPTSPSFERPVPEPSIFAPELVAAGSQAPDRARILLKRDLAMQLGACRYEVFIDHKRVAAIMGSEYLLLDVPPARYGVHFQYGGIICPSFSSAPLQVDALAGTTRVVRMGARGMLGFIQLEERSSPQ